MTDANDPATSTDAPQPPAGRTGLGVPDDRRDDPPPPASVDVGEEPAPRTEAEREAQQTVRSISRLEESN